MSIAPIGNPIAEGFTGSWAIDPPLIVSNTELELVPDGLSLGIRSNSEPVFVIE